MEFWILIALAVLVIIAAGVWFLVKEAAKPQEPVSVVAEELPEKPVAKPAQPALTRTREAIRNALSSVWGQKANLTAQQWDEIEEALLSADLGITASQKFLSLLKGRLKDGPGSLQNEDLVAVGKELLSLKDQNRQHGVPAHPNTSTPLVISVVGVNGVGKTTTVGKLAHWYHMQGKAVLLGAADTFRAAATDQLKIWAERTGAQFVSGREQGDPGAVVFDALTAGKARGMDVVVIDTAGRLHTKTNLMEELGRVHRVMKKVIPDAPHEIWLVLDGNLGQNSVRQAKEFASVLPLTGVIVTKLDGSAKGGALFAITSELQLPIRFLGLGEAADDLVVFEPEKFIEQLI